MKYQLSLPLAVMLIAAPAWTQSQLRHISNLTPSSSALSFNGSSGDISSQPLTVTNTSSRPMVITGLSFSNATFSTTAASFPITLPPGQQYTFQITAHPQSTASTGSVSISSNTGAKTVALTETAAASTSGHSVALVWKKPTTGYNVVAYDVDRAASGSSSFSQVATTGGGTRNWTDTSVQAGKTYAYRIRSVGDTGETSAPSNTATFTIP